ncbi:MAG: EamA/RhaT family transporter [Clostridiales bacterium]|nr:EamA/RhaT family transporter [Clostridiales bacterium]
MSKQKDPRLLIILPMAIFGTLGPFVRNISVSSGELALYRAVLAALMIGSILLITKQKIPVGKLKKEIPLLLLSGAAMGFNWIFLFQAYKFTTVSTATLSYYFAPVIVTLLCPILFKEKLTLKQIVCFIFSTLGIVLITGIGGGIDSSDLIGIGFGLAAAVLYASVVLLNKFIKNVGGIHRTFLQFIAAIVVLIPYVAATSGVTLGSMNGTGWICLLFVGIVHTGICYSLYFTGLKDIPGQKAAILSYVDPLVAVVISVTVLSEPMSIQQVIGGILILGFTLLNEITPAREK